MTENSATIILVALGLSAVLHGTIATGVIFDRTTKMDMMDKIMTAVLICFTTFCVYAMYHTTLISREATKPPTIQKESHVRS